ncbi:MFS transporter [Nocardia beijingensis]|uniref:MFS transporter n=1 Tax=Nocardia beijingensis TaxID=95162 RepID=UPI001894D9B4|nr:MFS transporter [Nocardia beijingensis]MBF6077892.1 MFS transporter [Nocardia beijingensis]
MTSALRSEWRKRFNAFWLAQTVGGIGSAYLPFGLGLFAVTELHADASDMSALAAASLLPKVFITLHAGAYVEKLGRWRSMILANVVELAVWSGALIICVNHGATIPLLLAVAFCTESARMVNVVAFQSVTPMIVPDAELRSANAKFGVSESLAQFAGPLAGSWFFAVVGASISLAAAVGMVAVLAVALTILRLPEAPSPSVRRTSVTKLVLEGLRYVVTDRYLRWIAFANLSTNCFLAWIGALWLVFLARDIGWQPQVIGLVGAVGSLGGLMGGPVALWLTRRLGDGRTLLCFAIAYAPGYALAVLPVPEAWRTVLVTSGLLVVMTALVGYNVVQRTLRQTISMPETLARVNASMRWFSALAAPLGALLGGIAAAALGVQGGLVVGIAGLVAPGLVLLLSPLRQVEAVAETTSATDAAPAQEKPREPGAGESAQHSDLPADAL